MSLPSSAGKRGLHGLVAALRFLTIVPLPGWLAPYDLPIGRALPWFPVVGALVGGALAAAGWLAGWLWGDAVRAVALVVAWGVLTSGLHLDGLSDTFDGVMSWRPRERKLEIMRDSRIGVMGALALLAIWSLKIALLAGQGWLAAVLLAPVVGRWAMCYGLCGYPAARADGLGAQAQGESTLAALGWASLLVLGLALAFGGVRGLLALALAWLVVRWLARRWVAELGGLTGDTYGALCELAEVVALAAMTARW